MSIDSNRTSIFDSNRDLSLNNSLDNSLDNCETHKMAHLENIYKALRLVPDFDGNPNILTRFVRLCDQLVAEFIDRDPSDQLSRLALLNGILNKVTGPAARLINANGIPSDWNGIRTALVNNFSDQRDETALYNDLAILTQGSGSPQEFYEKCQNIFATIMTYVTLHEPVETTVVAKRDLYKKLTLQAYLRGLKDPLGYRIRCMRPETIEKALEFVQSELNTIYLQQRNEHLPDKKWQVQTPNNQFKLPSNINAGVPPPRAFNFNMPGPSKQFMPSYQFIPPVHPQFRQNPNQSHQAGPSRTQQMFRAPPPNYNPNNAFRIPPRNSAPQFGVPSQHPRPMSGVSHFVSKPFRPNPFGNNAHDWTKSGNPPPSNYFRSREMNFNDCVTYDTPYDDYHSDYYSYNEPFEYSDYSYYSDSEPQFYDQYSQLTLENRNEEQGQTSALTANDNNQDFQIAPNSDKPK